MQNPNEDTQWNDVLRSKGIIPEKEVTEEAIVKMVDSSIKEKTDAGEGRSLRHLPASICELPIDELDALELNDEEEERVLEAYKQRRLAEMKIEQTKCVYGTVMEISGQDYVQEVTKAGEATWVVLHLYMDGVPQCALVNQYLVELAAKFPATKFIKSVATLCIPNYPEKNVPSLFVYFEGNLKMQLIGPSALRGMKLSIKELEYLLGQGGAVRTTIKNDPRKRIKDVLFANMGLNTYTYSSDEEEADADD